MALPDWDGIALNDRLVRIVFDSDVTTKREVASALVRLKGFLEQRHARVEVVYLPAAASGDKQGVDDFFAAGGTLQDLDQFASTEFQRPAEDDTTQPAIVVNGRFLQEVADDCWKVLVDGEPAPYLGLPSGRATLSRCRRPEGRGLHPRLVADDIPFVIERLAHFVRVTEEGTEVPDRMPEDVITDMMTTWNKPVPELRGIVGTPVFAADGTLITTTGYQERTRLLVSPRR